MKGFVQETYIVQPLIFKLTPDARSTLALHSVNQLKLKARHICIGLGSPIRRRSRSLGSGHKSCFEQISFEMFSECLNSKSKTVSCREVGLPLNKDLQ